MQRQKLYCLCFLEILLVCFGGNDAKSRTAEDCDDVPGLVLNLASSINEKSITISWDSVDDPSCLIGYRVTVGDNTYDVESSTTSYTFDYTEYCVTYDFKVAAVTDTSVGESAEISVIISAPSYIGAVENFNLDVIGNLLNATWEPPNNVEKCIAKYMLEIWDQNQNQKDYETTNTFYEFSPLIGCMEYNVQVKPWVNISKEGNTATLSSNVEDIVTNPPILNSISVNETWADFEWSIDLYSDNMCEILLISIQCDALPEDNGPFDWIVEYSKKTKNISDSSTRPPISVSVDDLSEFTNYTCFAFLTNTGGDSDFSELVTFQTGEGIPSAPQSVQITNITSSEFVVIWEAPQKIPGILTKYDISIEPREAVHYIPEECLTELATDRFEVDANANEIVYMSALPNYRYVINVNASTRVGSGPDESQEAQTLTAEPEPPRNLNYSLEIEQIVDYNVTAILSWAFPCNVNGELDKFQGTINGTSIVDSELLFQDTFFHERNDAIEDEEYLYFFRDIQASFVYLITIVSVLDDGTQSDPEYLEIVSPDGYPSAPTIKNVTDFEDSSFTITWREPDIKNGLIVTYNVTVTSNGPLYPTPESCEGNFEVYWVEVDNDATSYVFSKAESYYNYSVTVTAATSIGYGKESDPFIIISPESVPEKPTELMVDFEVKDLVNYDVEAIISWDLPCKSNGQLDYFNVLLNYTTLEGTSDWQQFQVDITDTYKFSIPNVQPGFFYQITVTALLVNGMEGDPEMTDFTAPEGIPGAPSVNNVDDPNTTSFEVTWNEPEIKNGQLTNYNVSIKSLGPMYPVPDDTECSKDTNFYSYIVESDKATLVFTQAKPYHSYKVSVKAATLLGYGAESEEIEVITLRGVPEVVRNLTYKLEQEESEQFNLSLTVSFLSPCNLFGDWNSFQFNLIGRREGHKDQDINDTFNTTIVKVLQLHAEYSYTIQIYVTTTTHQSDAVSETFTSPAGVPQETAAVEKPHAEGNNVVLLIHRDIFNDENGDILYYALLIGKENSNLTSTFGFWDGTAATWPRAQLEHILFRQNDVYQTTPMFWNPFKDNENDAKFILGSGDCYDDGFCNEKLQSETVYTMMLRGFTSAAYRDCQPLTFKSLDPEDVKHQVIIIVVCSVVGALLITAFMFVLWRRRHRFITKKPSMLREEILPPPIPLKQFCQHFEDIKLNYNKLKVEYTVLGTQTVDLNLPKTTAELTENKPKNRYTNVLPYDKTRVILNGSENISNYINASYIEGYSGEKEYIASQGPLKTTCADFWQMILQDNVRLIAMVAHFVEQNKDKCFRYFPQINETLDAGELQITCEKEENFGTYIERSLLIGKAGNDVNTPHTVTHLQFLDWPDFGCPTSTEAMIQYCRLLREKQREIGGKIVVHCSAGVGRSGTLIAIDILLQTIDANADIDVFRTVLNLRKQRENMVQTEKQYMYIHRCINDAIEQASKHLYNNKIEVADVEENVNLVKIEANT